MFPTDRRASSACRGLVVLHTLRRSRGCRTRQSRYVIRPDVQRSMLTSWSQDNILFGAPFDEERYNKGE